MGNRKSNQDLWFISYQKPLPLKVAKNGYDNKNKQ
jgi:hypothetical protein